MASHVIAVPCAVLRIKSTSVEPRITHVYHAAPKQSFWADWGELLHAEITALVTFTSRFKGVLNG